MQQPSPLVSSGASGAYSTASGRGYAEVTMIPVATAGPCYKECSMILPFMVLLFFMTLLVAVTQMPVLMVVLRSGKTSNDLGIVIRDCPFSISIILTLA